MLKAVILLLLLAGAYLGLSFSPGFSAIFLFVFLCLSVFSELLHHKNSSAGRILMLLGSCFLIPAVYIYAVGDDWLDWTLPTALILSAVLYLLCFRKKGSAAEHSLRLILLMSGVFSLFSSMASTALLPVAAGVLLIFVSRLLIKERDLPFIAGICLCACFLVAPMLFPGGAL